MSMPHLARLSRLLACLAGLALAGCDATEAPDAPESETLSPLDPITPIVNQRKRGGETACQQRLLQWRYDLALGAHSLLRGTTLEGSNVPFLLFERSDHLGGEARMLYCPSVRPDQEAPSRAAIDRHDPAATDYEGPDGFEATRQTLGKPDFPLLWDREGNHDGFRHVLFTDGRVERIEEPDFREMENRLTALRQSLGGG